ncbi:hypothetical protein ABW21_db0204054 [Orbilia brochopaga]|nr:hypothetical protein ABW21_db0204054 [Drechslerella brochopaga]
MVKLIDNNDGHLTIKAQIIPTKRDSNGHKSVKRVRIPACATRAETIIVHAPSSPSNSTSSTGSYSSFDSFDQAWYISYSSRYLQDHLAPGMYCQQRVLSTDAADPRLVLSENELNSIARNQYIPPWKMGSIKSGGDLMHYGADGCYPLSEIGEYHTFRRNSETATERSGRINSNLDGWKLVSAISGRVALLDMGAGIPPDCAVWKDNDRGRKLNPTNWASKSHTTAGLYVYRQPHGQDPRLVGVASTHNDEDAIYCAENLVFVWKPDMVRQQISENHKEVRVHPRIYYQKPGNPTNNGHAVIKDMENDGTSLQHQQLGAQLHSATGFHPSDTGINIKSSDASQFPASDNAMKLVNNPAQKAVRGLDSARQVSGGGGQVHIQCDGAADEAKWPSWINDGSGVCEEDIENAPVFERSNGEGIRVVYITKDPGTGRRVPIVDFVGEHDERYNPVKEMVEQGRCNGSTADNLTVDCPQVNERELRARLALAYDNMEAKLSLLKRQEKTSEGNTTKESAKWKGNKSSGLSTVLLGAKGPIPLDDSGDDVFINVDCEIPEHANLPHGCSTDFNARLTPDIKASHGIHTKRNNVSPACKALSGDLYPFRTPSPHGSRLGVLSIERRPARISTERDLDYFQIDHIRSFYPLLTTPDSETKLGPPTSPVLQSGVPAAPPPLPFKSVSNYPVVAGRFSVALTNATKSSRDQSQGNGTPSKLKRQLGPQINPYVALFAGRISEMPQAVPQRYPPIIDFREGTLIHGGSYFPELIKHMSDTECYPSHATKILPTRIDMYPGYMYDFEDWMAYGRHGLPGRYEDSGFTKPQTLEAVLTRLQDHISWERNRIKMLMEQAHEIQQRVQARDAGAKAQGPHRVVPVAPTNQSFAAAGLQRDRKVAQSKKLDSSPEKAFSLAASVKNSISPTEVHLQGWSSSRGPGLSFTDKYNEVTVGSEKTQLEDRIAQAPEFEMSDHSEQTRVPYYSSASNNPGNARGNEVVLRAKGHNGDQYTTDLPGRQEHHDLVHMLNSTGGAASPGWNITNLDVENVTMITSFSNQPMISNHLSVTLANIPFYQKLISLELERPTTISRPDVLDVDDVVICKVAKGSLGLVAVDIHGAPLLSGEPQLLEGVSKTIS